VVLPGGHALACPAAPGVGPGAHHVSIRPERVTLAAAGDLTATVDRVVYLGTDLQLLVRLEGGAPFSLRLQNAARVAVPAPGDRVALHLEEGAARLLAD
jgi:spermidine/putrescine transport system ATP-binding protein